MSNAPPGRNDSFFVSLFASRKSLVFVHCRNDQLDKVLLLKGKTCNFLLKVKLVDSLMKLDIMDQKDWTQS